MKTNTSTSQSPNNWMTAVQLPHDWTNVSFGAPDLRLCRITYQDLPGSSPLVVTRSLIVKQDHSWVLNVHGHTVDASKVPFLRTLPVELNSDSATLLLSRLADLNTCAGNPEQKFTALGEAKKNGQFLSVGKEVVAYVDCNACVAVGRHQYPSTIRCSRCHLLTDGIRCPECAAYRKNLLAQHSRAVRRSSSVRSKKTNFR